MRPVSYAGVPMTIAREFADYCVDLSLEDVDDATVEYTKKLLLDTLGTIVGGYHWSDSADVMVGTARSLHGGSGAGSATVLSRPASSYRPRLQRWQMGRFLTASITTTDIPREASMSAPRSFPRLWQQRRPSMWTVEPCSKRSSRDTRSPSDSGWHVIHGRHTSAAFTRPGRAGRSERPPPRASSTVSRPTTS